MGQLSSSGTHLTDSNPFCGSSLDSLLGLSRNQLTSSLPPPLVWSLLPAFFCVLAAVGKLASKQQGLPAGLPGLGESLETGPHSISMNLGL